MPMRTKKLSSVKATDVRKQKPGHEPSQDAQLACSFFKMPPELQKTVVEYVRTPACHSATPCLPDDYLARTPVRLGNTLSRFEGPTYLDASILVPRRHVVGAQVGRRSFTDLQLGSPWLVPHPIATYPETLLSLFRCDRTLASALQTAVASAQGWPSHL